MHKGNAMRWRTCFALGNLISDDPMKAELLCLPQWLSGNNLNRLNREHLQYLLTWYIYRYISSLLQGEGDFEDKQQIKLKAVSDPFNLAG